MSSVQHCRVPPWRASSSADGTGTERRRHNYYLLQLPNPCSEACSRTFIALALNIFAKHRTSPLLLTVHGLGPEHCHWAVMSSLALNHASGKDMLIPPEGLVKLKDKAIPVVEQVKEIQT